MAFLVAVFEVIVSDMTISCLAAIVDVSGAAIWINSPSPLVVQTEKGLAQQDELWNNFWSDPDNGVLIKVNPNGFGSLQG